LLGIDHKKIQEIWEVDHIAVSSTSKPHYVVILRDMTLLCTCTGGYKKYWPPNKCDIKEAYIIIFLFKSIHIFFLNYM
jgi:hypothetical protein